MTISREQVIARLRQANYTYKKRGPRTELYKKKGCTHRIFVPRRKVFTEQLVRIVLGQAGLTPGEVEDFLSSAVK